MFRRPDRQSEWNTEPPLSNAAVQMFGAQARQLNLEGVGTDCPRNPGRIHIPLSRIGGRIRIERCVDKPFVFSLPVSAPFSNPCSRLRAFRTDVRFSPLRPRQASGNLEASKSLVNLGWRTVGVVTQGEEYTDQTPPWAQRKRRKATRDLGRVSLGSTLDGDPVPADLLQLHRQWLAARFPGTLLASERGWALLHEFRQIDLFWLRFGLDIVAVAICLTDLESRNMSYYSPAYDQRAAQYSPGTILFHEIVTWARYRELANVDLGALVNGYKFPVANANYFINWHEAPRGTMLEHGAVAANYQFRDSGL